MDWHCPRLLSSLLSHDPVMKSLWYSLFYVPGVQHHDLRSARAAAPSPHKPGRHLLHPTTPHPHPAPGWGAQAPAEWGHQVGGGGWGAQAPGGRGHQVGGGGWGAQVPGEQGAPGRGWRVGGTGPSRAGPPGGRWRVGGLAPTSSSHVTVQI